MILAIDIGNTTVGLGGIERGANGEIVLRFAARMNTVPGRSEDAYLAEMRSVFAARFIDEHDFEGAILVSVVPRLVEPLADCARTICGHDPVIVSAGIRSGLILNVPSPESIGRDRLADAAYAAAHFPLPVVTVDMGTATTFNVIDEGAVFVGGLIAPGLATGLNALSERAAQLPPIRLKTPDYVYGKTTVECMIAGAAVGAAAMIDGIAERVEAALGKPVSLVITGGLARHVEPLCRHEHTYDPDLLLKGLALLYMLNT